MQDDECLVYRWDHRFGRVFDPLPHHPIHSERKHKIMVNPEWEKATIGIDFFNFDMIYVGPPPTYLIDADGQLEFSFVLDIIDLDE